MDVMVAIPTACHFLEFPAPLSRHFRRCHVNSWAAAGCPPGCYGRPQSPGCICTYRAIKYSSSATVWTTEMSGQRDGLFKKLGGPSSRDKKLPPNLQTCAHLSLRTSEAVILLSTDHKRVCSFGLADILTYELYLCFQDHWIQPFKLSLHPFAMLNCPWSCRLCLEAKWAHFTPNPAGPGQNDKGQQHLAKQSHQVAACWAL